MPVSTELAGIAAVDVIRGERVESTHAVAACACDDAGNVQLEHGTIDVPVFLRSAAKPFIAAACVRAGVVERFGLDAREIAVMCASHSGEPLHLQTVASLLRKIGATADDLQCGGAPSALNNNCSGKHAGILALARLRDEPFAGYLDVAHPVEREILDFCERAFADRFTPDRLAVDGCGIPVFATTLRSAARGFARFATLSGFDDADAAALGTVRAAMVAHPWLVAGTGRFDTDLMEATAGAVVAKTGAEGVHATAVPARGLGLVVKVVDGATRAAPPATLVRLRALDVLDDATPARLPQHARTPIRNVAGRVVGSLSSRAC
jgi:L-asparaginase II